VKPAVVILSSGPLQLARKIAGEIGGEVHGLTRRVDGCDRGFDDVASHMRALFAERRPVVAVMAAGAVIRLLADSLTYKHTEPPVIAVSEDGASVVPLLGGHHGANALARRIASLLGGHAAITTAGDLRFGVALDEPPAGYRLANPERAKEAMAALLAGASVRIEGEAPWLEASGLPISDDGEVKIVVSERAGETSGRPLTPLWPAGEASAPPVSSSRSSSLAGPRPYMGGDQPASIEVPLLQRRRLADAPGNRVISPLEGEMAGRPEGGANEGADPGQLVLQYVPQILSLGLGCERGTDPAEAIELAEAALVAHDLSPLAIAGVFSLDLKADEAAVHAVTAHFGVAARFFDAARLEGETARLQNPSDAVFAEVGCHGVAEAAALAAAGPEAVLAVPKMKSKRATVALARAPRPLDAGSLGRARGTLFVVGIGPGSDGWRSPEVTRMVERATDLVGYSLYLDLLGPLAKGKARHDYDLGAEELRVRRAMELAGEGRTVALVCSGDAGIYAMATLVFELLAKGDLPDAARRIEITVSPGISALQAAAARAGAPLGHDFCTISLSDLLTPWEAIEARIKAAAEADFVIAFYNPVSKKRRTQLAFARDVLLAHRPADCPVILATNLGREGEEVRIVPLAALDVDEVDMLTVVIVGSSQTRTVQTGDGRNRVYTPRGYAGKAGSAMATRNDASGTKAELG